MAELVDLRSDTVTRPTAEMRRAMAEADVGDDGYREDPTVRALEEELAARLGREGALYVPSGTMANQLALRLLAPPGTLIVAGRRQHVVAHEAGAAGVNSAAQACPVADDGGRIAASDVSWVRAAAHHHQPEPGLVCVENTHMAAGGTPWDVESLAEVVRAASPVPVHMDGARLFNAEVATGIPAASFTEGMTTVMTCLSKGLCAPVGSCLVGAEDLIEAARAERKRLGGAMRQAGIIAAAGLVALRTMVERLAEDHERARRLAGAVAARWPRTAPDMAQVRTNIVVFPHPSPDHLLDQLAKEGILAGTVAPGVVRLMTHRDVGDAAVDHAAKVIATLPE